MIAYHFLVLETSLKSNKQEIIQRQCLDVNCKITRRISNLWRRYILNSLPEFIPAYSLVVLLYDYVDFPLGMLITTQKTYSLHYGSCNSLVVATLFSRQSSTRRLSNSQSQERASKSLFFPQFFSAIMELVFLYFGNLPLVAVVFTALELTCWFIQCTMVINILSNTRKKGIVWDKRNRIATSTGIGQAKERGEVSNS